MNQAYEGDASTTEHCAPLGKFELSWIPPAPRCVRQIDVTLVIDANGILNVSTDDNATNKNNKHNHNKNDKGRLIKEEIERMDTEGEKYKAEDDVQNEKVEARNQLENFCYQVKSMAEEQLGER